MVFVFQNKEKFLRALLDIEVILYLVNHNSFYLWKKKICFNFRIWFSWPVWSILCWWCGLHGPVSPATSPSVVGVSQTWICGLFERRVGLKLIVMSYSIHSCNESLNRYLLDIFNCNHLFDIRINKYWPK